MEAGENLYIMFHCHHHSNHGFRSLSLSLTHTHTHTHTHTCTHIHMHTNSHTHTHAHHRHHKERWIGWHWYLRIHSKTVQTPWVPPGRWPPWCWQRRTCSTRGPQTLCTHCGTDPQGSGTDTRQSPSDLKQHWHKAVPSRPKTVLTQGSPLQT